MRQVFFLILLYFGVITLATAQRRVLYIGDSITDGGWGRSGGSAKASKDRNHSDLNHVYGHSYMMLCAAHYQSQWPDADWQFWNRGISGNTLPQVAARWQEDALNLQPDVISILIGTNDVGAYLDECKKTGSAFTPEGFDYRRWEQQYRHLIDTTRMVLPKAEMVLCTPFVGKETGAVRMMITDSLAQIVRHIAQDYQAVTVPFDSLFTTLQQNEPTAKYWIWDGIHPTAAGHQRMAELWQLKADGILALPTATEGQPQWIASDVTGAVPYFAHDFVAKQRVKKATLRASALGVMTLRLNGKPVSENRLEPGESQYDQTVLYCTYDVTPLMKKGENRLLAKVGGGLFCVPNAPGRYTKPEIKNNGTSAFLCQLDIEYKDGSKEQIFTDASWLTAPSPTLLSNWWGGEDYDARREPQAADWHAVKVVNPTTNLPIEEFLKNPQHQRPIGQLRPQEHEPIRVVEEWKASSITPLANGDYVVDFGQNFAGTFEFTLKGRKGQTIRLQTSEQLNPDGTVNAQECYCGPIVVYDTYTFGHDGIETWSPELMYHGFRYMQVSGLTEKPRPGQFKAQRMRVSCQATGHFETSNTLINQIHRICRNSIESQLFHVFTDCPQREKMGWLDVPNQMYNSIALNFDFRRLSHKIVRDCFDAQAYYDGAKRGKVPSTVPHFFTDWDDDPNWGGSAILLPYRTWKTYGDRSLMEQWYDGMKRLIDYYTSLTEDGLMPGSKYSRLSDWGQESSGLKNKTVPEFTISCTYHYLLKVMAEIARETGHETDAQGFEQQAAKTRAAFNARFYNDSTAIYAHGNQAELAMPLYYGLTEEKEEQRVADRLAEKVVSDGYKVKTGECGLKPVLMMLAQYGHNDIVWQMVCQTDYPSYGYWVRQGCTSTPELWDMRYSQNHCMLDHIEEWFYTHLAGIQNAGTAYDHIRLQPYVPTGLDSLSASVKTPSGSVVSEFHRQADGSVRYRFAVPQGSTATIVLPGKEAHEAGGGEYEYTIYQP